MTVALLTTGACGCADTGLPADQRGEASADRDLAADLADAARIRANLTKMRAQRVRGPALPFLVAEPKLRGARARILAGDPVPEVIDDEMQLAADNGERDIATWCVTAPSLEALRIPTRLLNAGHLSVAIVVVRPPQADERVAPPYVVLFAMADPYQSE